MHEMVGFNKYLVPRDFKDLRESVTFTRGPKQGYRTAHRKRPASGCYLLELNGS